MSSQGPKAKNNPAGVPYVPALNILANTNTVDRGYTFDRDTIRDSSDWIAYKKQVLVFKEPKNKSFTDPWFVHGNDYRLTFMQGRHKQPNSAPSCVPCDSSAFVDNGPFPQ